MSDEPKSELIIYQTEDGNTRSRVRMDQETAWLTLNQMADLFQRDKSVISRFFATVQNKRHWAAHAHTAAEIVAERADASKPNMGLTSWSGSKPRKSDVVVAKNYLNQDEPEALNRIVTAYLEFAELQAQDRKPM